MRLGLSTPVVVQTPGFVSGWEHGAGIDDVVRIAAAQLWALDGSYAVEGWSMNNRAEVADMVRSEAHQGLIGGGSTHFLGPAVVTVDVDDAVAVCESLLVVRHEKKYLVARAGVHHFQLRRLDGRWQIIRRICRTLDGDAEARRLLAAGVAGLNGGSR